MNAAERRQKILSLLESSRVPVNATALAGACRVSRQVIVGDIALLRAFNYHILSTPRGYLYPPGSADENRRYVIACRHTKDQLQKELYLVVDNGGGILDVIVEHPVYGQISGGLHIFSRHDVDTFMNKLNNGQASPLSRLTDGVHLHTICCRKEEDYQRILSALEAEGILFHR